MATNDIISAVSNATAISMKNFFDDVTTNFSQSEIITMDTTTPSNDMMEEDIYIKTKLVLSRYIYPVIVLVGIIANTLSLVVFLTKEMRSISVNNYLVTLAVTDMLVLFLDFISSFFKRAFGIYTLGVTDFLCQLYRFCMTVSYTLSAWLVVAVTLERFIIVFFPLKAKIVTSVKRARVVILILFILLFFLKLYHFWIWEVHEDGSCNWKKGWEEFHSGIHTPLTFAPYSYIPLVVLIICNSGIIIKIKQSSRNQAKLTSDSSKSEKEARRITVSVLLISFAYMIFTVPLSAFYTVMFADYSFIPQTSKMALGETIIDLLGLCNYGINFFLYVFSSERFRTILGKKLCIKESSITEKSPELKSASTNFSDLNLSKSVTSEP